MRLRLDALHELWRERILGFDQTSQNQLLLLLHIPEPDGQKLVLVMGIGLALGLAWLTWQVRRELRPPTKDPLIRAYERLCRRLAAVGLPRSAHEGAETYAARIARARPDLAAAVTTLCRRYIRLRYGANPARAAELAFIAGVRAFRAPRNPGRRRGKDGA
jgi:protein-glutamine gamma-glutamyltransferase